MDSDPVAAHASTRNQGWIHQGALYAGKDQAATAKECLEGHRRIMEFIDENDLEATLEGVRSFYLLHNEEYKNLFCRRLDDVGIPYEGDILLGDVREQDPLVAGGDSPIEEVVEVYDTPVNTETLLNELIIQSHGMGSRFLSIERPVTAAQIDRAGNNWIIDADGHDIRAKVVVFSCGPAIPEFLASMELEGVADRFRRMKILVTALHRAIFGNLLVVPTDLRNREAMRRPPNISPFFREGATRPDGVSICLANADIQIEEATDTHLVAHNLDQLCEKLEEYHPALVEFVRSQGAIPAHTYYCQKIELTKGDAGDRSHFVLDHGEDDWGGVDGLISFYPGKFTATPVAADDAMTKIDSYLGDDRPSLPDLPIPQLASRPYFDGPTRQLRLDGMGNLKLR